MNASGRGSQASFLFEIKGAPKIEVAYFQAQERISEPFVVHVALASTSQIQYDAVIQKEALLTLSGAEADRHFHGIVRKFEHTGRSGQKYLYQADIVPSLMLLSLKQDCRIFQDKQDKKVQDQKVQDIVAQIFQKSGIPADRYEFRLTNKDRRRKFCVQYRETDMDFVCRLLQEEGIFYFFEHSEDKHVMVFGDDTVNYKPIEGNQEVSFKPASGLNPEKESISYVDFSRRLRPGTYTHTNYNFKKPSVDLETKEKGRDAKQQNFEIYDYPGQYGQEDRGKRLAKIHLEAGKALEEQANGTSTCPRLLPGFTFKLDGHDFKAFNREYLLVGVSHSGQQPQALEEQSGSDAGASYSNTFLAIPSTVTYRPLRTIEKPFVRGMQTATVVGRKGEEIHTDEWGRVAVQFHWDRLGKNDENSSCWIRAGQMWGGGGWGAQFIPRVGDEVLVDFMEGDPDRPIIVGSVYNEGNQPLYDLKNNKTQSGIKTRSYPDGPGFNELRFEDKKGEEHIYLQGEKDWNILIKNDKGQSVGHDETLSVANNRTKAVGANQNETIGANHTETIGANMNVSVGGAKTETVGSSTSLSVGGSKSETVTMNSAQTIGAAKELTIGGLYQVSVGGIMNETVGGAKAEEVGLAKAVVVGANMTTKVMGKLTYDVGDQIEIQSGSSSLVMKSDGKIEISGKNVVMKTAAGRIEIDEGGIITIKGTMVKINN
jgi:type VI secretion system secreted protein VgrG